MQFYFYFRFKIQKWSEIIEKEQKNLVPADHKKATTIRVSFFFFFLTSNLNAPVDNVHLRQLVPRGVSALAWSRCILYRWFSGNEMKFFECTIFPGFKRIIVKSYTMHNQLQLLVTKKKKKIAIKTRQLLTNITFSDIKLYK